MHELSIALGIVRIAENEKQKANATTIDKIELEIGELSGVEISSLDFVWPIVIKETVLEKAEYSIDYIEGQANCLECGEHYQLHNLFDNCPVCDGYFKNIIAGKELRVKALEVS